MDTAAEGRKHAYPPVAEFIAGALHNDGAVVGDDAGGGFLVGEELDQVVGGAGVEVMFRDQAGESGGFRECAQFADQGANAAAEL